MRKLSRGFYFAILNLMICVAAFGQDASDLMKQGAELQSSGKHEEAIGKFSEALKLDPTYPQGYYNLGVAYSGAKKYAEGEGAAVEALKRSPQNPSNYRLYGLVTFHENKRGDALLAFCDFLLLEPNTTRSAETVSNIQSILKGGVLKNGVYTGQTVTLTPEDKHIAVTLAIGSIVLNGQSKKLTGTDLLEYELTHIFTEAGHEAEKEVNKDFFDKFFAAYLYKLAQSGNMPAFAHIVAQYINKDENAKWLAANPDKVDALNKWVQTTQREM